MVYLNDNVEVVESSKYQESVILLYGWEVGAKMDMIIGKSIGYMCVASKGDNTPTFYEKVVQPVLQALTDVSIILDSGYAFELQILLKRCY